MNPLTEPVLLCELLVQNFHVTSAVEIIATSVAIVRQKILYAPTAQSEGIFAKVCLPNRSDKSAAMMILGSTNMGNKQKSSVKKAAIDIKLNDTALKGLIDTGSSNTFISAQTVNSLNLELQPCISPASLESADITNAIGDCVVTLSY